MPGRHVSVPGIGVAAGRDVNGDLTINTMLTDSGPSSAGVSVTPPIGRLPSRIWGRQDAVDEVLSALRELVEARRARRTAPESVWLLHGLGGVGKSAAALAITVGAAQAGISPYWVDASDRSRVRAAMWQVARQLGAPDTQAPATPDEAGAVDAIWRVLENSATDWLLVFDNADDPALLAADGERTAAGNGWVRASGRGLVLVTSRVGEPSVWGQRVRIHRLGMLDRLDGSQVLLDSADLDPQERGVAREEAERLAERLGGLPLALRAAGRYLALARSRGGAVTIADYAGLLVQRFGATIDAGVLGSVPFEGGEPNPRDLVTATWDLSLDWLAERGMPEARTLLLLFGCYAGAPVPTSLLGDARPTAHGPSDRVGEVVAALRALGLVDERDDSGNDSLGRTDALVTVHPLVREVMRERLLAEPTTAGMTYGAALRRLTAAVTTAGNGDQLNARLLHILEPHLREIAVEVAGNEELLPPRLRRQYAELLAQVAARRVWSVLPADVVVTSLTCYLAYTMAVAGTRSKLSRRIRHQRGHALWSLRRYDDAKIDFRDAANLVMRPLFRLAPEAALMLQTSVCGLRTVGAELEEQVQIVRKQLALLERHPLRRTRRAWRTRRNLASVLRQHGHLAEAERALRAILDEQWARLGEGDPVTLDTWLVLALLLHRAGQLHEAEAALRGILTIEQRARDAETVFALRVRSSLAAVLRDRDQVTEAENEYQATIEALVRRRGAGDPLTLAVRRDVADFLRQQGRYSEAEAEYRAILEVERSLAGDDNSSVWMTRSDLALVAREQDRLTEAEQEYRAVWQAFERTRGEADPSTLAARRQLAVVLADQERYSEAEAELRAVLAVQAELLGMDDPETLDSRERLARVLSELQRHDDARVEYEALLAARRRLLGEDALRTISTAHRLAHVVAECGRFRSAETLFRDTVRRRSAVLGADDIRTLKGRRCLARHLRNGGDLEGAETEYRAALDGMRRTRGDQDENTLRTWHELARVLMLGGHPEKAEPELRRVLQLYTDHPDGDRVEEVQFDRAQALYQLGRYDEAAVEFGPVVEGMIRDLGADNPATRTARALRALCLHRYTAAVEDLSAALDAARRIHDAPHAQTMHIEDLLVEALLGAGEPERARALAEESLGARMEWFGKEHPSTALARDRVQRLVGG